MEAHSRIDIKLGKERDDFYFQVWNYLSEREDISIPATIKRNYSNKNIILALGTSNLSWSHVCSFTTWKSTYH